ncbi:MAG: radical SAM protein [Candidatus Omnitrophica bacterium]|nr:radical SAM protein [Candidatus Omnitrophota bacterium]
MKRKYPQLLICDQQGRIYNLPDWQATGMKGGCFFPLGAKELIKLPAGSELFMLPGRLAVGYDRAAQRCVVLEPKGYFPVAAFVSPGFTITYNSSFRQLKKCPSLPLFSYAAVCFYRGEFYVSALRVDRELRQDLRLMDLRKVRKNTAQLKKVFPRNRLIKHLENCALVYSCPAAKNFFLSRYEAPLPSSPFCNAYCAGCISYQPKKSCPITQPRIKFIPRPEELAEVALYHLQNVADPVVSFGQGCEGEPLLVAGVLEESIKLIRKKTAKGIINLNTNASKPQALARLFDAGLDSIRVSLNSARETYYRRYYRPRGYAFNDLIQSIKVAKEKKGFVSINYLTMPGFTDSLDEYRALKNFVATQRIDMIQWRNLNFDPLKYFTLLKINIRRQELLGLREIIHSFRKQFPRLAQGYFNPSRLRMKRKIAQTQKRSH